MIDVQVYRSQISVICERAVLKRKADITVTRGMPSHNPRLGGGTISKINYWTCGVIDRPRALPMLYRQREKLLGMLDRLWAVVQQPPESGGIESPEAESNVTPLLAHGENSGPTKLAATVLWPECGHHVTLELSIHAAVGLKSGELPEQLWLAGHNPPTY